MNYRLILLNLFLVVVLVIGGVSLRNWASAYEAAHQPNFVRAMPESLPQISATSTLFQSTPEDWTDIPTKNLFSFDRTDITLVAPAPPPPQNIGSKPFLFGTVSLGKDRMAMVAPGQPGNRNFRPMRVGESIDGWTIVDIQEKAMIVAANNSQTTIIMNDPTAQIPRDYSRTSGPASPVAAPTPVAPPASAAPNGPKRTRVIQTPFGPKVVEDPPPPPND